MITLIGGPLRQWDLDRQVRVLNKNITTLQFCNQHHCFPHEVAVVDGMAVIPNALLQIAQEIEVYGLVGDETVYSCRLDVNGRQKPSDYPIGEPSSGGGGLTLEEVQALIDKQMSSIPSSASSEPDAIIDYDTEEYIQGDFRAIWDKLQNDDIPKVIMKHTEDDHVALMECKIFEFEPSDGVELGYDHIWITVQETDGVAFTSMTLTDDDCVYCSPDMCIPPEGDEWEA